MFKWLAVIIVVAALAGGYYQWQNQQAPTVSYQTAEVTRGTVENNVTALGELEPIDYVDVGTQVSGQLKKLHVDIGDEVKQGQLLAEIDSAVYATAVRSDRAKLKELEANLAEQQAQLKLAQLQLKRNRELLRNQVTSQETLESSQASLEQAQAKIEALKAQIEQAQATLDKDSTNLSYTKINAPLSGTVVDKSAVQGQTLNANQTTPTIVRVAQLDRMTVKAQVAEADIVKLKLGTAVYFTTLGTPERRWRSTVRQILPTPEEVNDVVLYSVLIDIDNSDRTLMTTMTAQVFFVLDSASEVLLVPTSALRSAADGSTQVRVLENGRPTTRSVQIGVRSRTVAEVRSGLQLGERVIIGDGAAKAGAANRSRIPMPPGGL